MSDKTNKKGIVIYNSALYKNFAILMQDTTLSGNRFDKLFGLPVVGNQTVNPKNGLPLPAFIVDSTLLVKSEEKIVKSDSSVTFYNYSEDNLKTHLKKYIRLYIGYIDTAHQLNVVVQFVTPKEYKRDEKINSQQLWLLAQQRDLRFAIIKFKRNELMH